VAAGDSRPYRDPEKLWGWAVPPGSKKQKTTKKKKHTF
jgi:hypothetical protein